MTAKSRCIEDARQRVRHWMFETALPFWFEQGVDRRDGGYVEMFDAHGQASASFKRTRVMARQLYVFSHASLLGWKSGLSAARHGYVFLRDNAHLGHGRWARRLSRQGEVIDETPDLYDHAFVLFALGWYARASGEREPFDLALEGLEALAAHFRHPKGGYAHELPMIGWRQQNPHMHLLEAALALHAADPNETRYTGLASEIVELFRTRFFDGRTLAEYFKEDWGRAPGLDGRLVEPGHQFEWAWILWKHGQLSGADMTAEICALYEFADIHGVDPATGVTCSVVLDNGKPYDRGSRTWPNTERIKGAIAYGDITGKDVTTAVLSAVNALFDRHLDHRGTWAEAFDAQGRPVTNTVPASTLYHLFLAFSEI